MIKINDIPSHGQKFPYSKIKISPAKRLLFYILITILFLTTFNALI
jgi:hypothetical protein